MSHQMTVRGATSVETAANFRAVYQARQQRRRAGHAWRPPCFWDPDDLACLRETMLAKVHRLTPRMPAEIYRRTRETFGTCSEERLYRARRWLTDTGLVVRVPDGYLLARRRPS